MAWEQNESGLWLPATAEPAAASAREIWVTGHYGTAVIADWGPCAFCGERVSASPPWSLVAVVGARLRERVACSARCYRRCVEGVSTGPPTLEARAAQAEAWGLPKAAEMYRSRKLTAARGNSR